MGADKKSQLSKKQQALVKKVGLLVLVLVAAFVLNKVGLLEPVMNLLGVGTESSVESSFEEQSFNVTDGESSQKSNESTSSGNSESSQKSNESTTSGNSEASQTVTKGKSYYSKDEVALYLHTYGELPPNYITKTAAENAGWDSEKGNLWKVTDKKCIGGDKFNNREKIVPTKSGRTWYECDVNYNGGYRGAERLLYSNDGLIYYTNDHYESATKLY